MKNSFILFFVFFLINVSFIESQTQQALLNRTKHWRFGVKLGLDFNTVTGIPAIFNGSHGIAGEGNSCISDTLGNLLFYCTGDTVWNKNHQMMMNGSSLTSDYVSGVNSAIIPRPGNANQYFLFVNSCTNNSPNNGGGLRYSIIDMTLDGGNGAIMPGQKNILAFSNVTCYNLAVTKNSNNTDYWIGYAEGVAPYNICMIPVKATGPDTLSRVISSYPGGLGAFTRFSPDNTLYASTAYEVFQFNAATGVLNNKLTFPTDSFFANPYQYSPFSLEFSPNSKVIYFPLNSYSPTHKNLIQQFSLLNYNQSAVNASIYNFYDYPGSVCFNCIVGHSQLALNGKIYISAGLPDSSNIIHNPNALGAACNFEYHGLPTNNINVQTGFTSPIFPDYYFNNIPLLTSIKDYQSFNSLPVFVFPNPCDEILTVSHSILNNYSYFIYNQLGETVLKHSNNQLRTKINTSSLPGGLYYISIQSSFGSQTKKIIINH